MVRKILCVIASVLLVIFLGINIVALFDSINSYGHTVIENSDGTYTSDVRFTDGICSPFGWLKLTVLILYSVLVAIALVNIFKKNTVLTSILLGGSLFAGIFFKATKLTYLFGTYYFMTVRYYLRLGRFMSFDDAFAFQDVVFFWSYMLVAVLLIAVLVIKALEKKHPKLTENNEKEA